MAAKPWKAVGVHLMRTIRAPKQANPAAKSLVPLGLGLNVGFGALPT